MKASAISAALVLATGCAGGALGREAAAPTVGEPEVASFSTMMRERLSPEVSRQVLNGENLTVSRWELKAGARVPMHKHANEQVSIILSGRSLVTSGGSSFVMKPDDVIRFPPNVEHEFLILEDTVALDIFAPRRDDWIAAAKDKNEAKAEGKQ